MNREREETKRHKNELEQRITEVRRPIVQFVFVFVFVFLQFVFVIVFLFVHLTYKQTFPGEGVREESRR